MFLGGLLPSCLSYFPVCFPQNLGEKIQPVILQCFRKTARLSPPPVGQCSVCAIKNLFFWATKSSARGVSCFGEMIEGMALRVCPFLENGVPRLNPLPGLHYSPRANVSPSGGVSPAALVGPQAISQMWLHHHDYAVQYVGPKPLPGPGRRTDAAGLTLLVNCCPPPLPWLPVATPQSGQN